MFRSDRLAAVLIAGVAALGVQATAHAAPVTGTPCNVAAGSSQAVVQADVPVCNTIILAAGRYAWTNHVALSSPVTIEGAGKLKTFITATGGTNIFEVTAPGSTIEKLNLDTSGETGSPPPGTIFSAVSHTSVLNVISKAGSGFGMRFTGSQPCDAYPTQGTVIANVSTTNTGTGGFTSLDIDCTDGATLTNINVNGDYVAFFQDKNVTMTGETYQANVQKACANDWFITAPSDNLTFSNVVTHNGKGTAPSNSKGSVTNLTVTNETYAPGDTCTNGI